MFCQRTQQHWKLELGFEPTTPLVEGQTPVSSATVAPDESTSEAKLEYFTNCLSECSLGTRNVLLSLKLLLHWMCTVNDTVYVHFFKSRSLHHTVQMMVQNNGCVFQYKAAFFKEPGLHEQGHQKQQKPEMVSCKLGWSSYQQPSCAH